MTITYKILSEEEYNNDFYSNLFETHNDGLSELGGCGDYGDEFGLGQWTYQFEIEVTKNNETKKFTIAFQPTERNNRLENYCGYSVSPATFYGYEADESSELEEFCDYDATILFELQEIAEAHAEKELEKLLKLKKEI